MDQLTLRSSAEQVAIHLRAELVSRALSGTMPGVIRLENLLGVNRKTVELGLRLLEAEGLLVAQGPGRRRLIKLPSGLAPPTLRVTILTYEPLELTEGYISEALHLLTEAGHRASFASKSLTELGMNVTRIARYVARNEADAWVLVSGSQEVLEWFSAQSASAFAVFGRRRELPIAGTGPDKPQAFAAATRRLIELGHRRIVMLARRERRLPEPGASERAFLDELEAHGIRPGPYNLPNWEENIADFHGCLDALFNTTPPSALICGETPFFIAAQQFLAERGLRVPQDVSLICADGDPHFAWCHPSIAHIRWDSGPVVRRIVRWANNVAHGKEDIRQTEIKAEFVEGGTVGPAAR